MTVLSLRFCARAFSSCGKWGPLFIAVRGPLIIAASLVAEHRLQTRRLSNCGSRAQLLRGMWDPPRPGLEPVSPALAGRFSTTAPPGKPIPLYVLFSSFLTVTSQQPPLPTSSSTPLLHYLILNDIWGFFIYNFLFKEFCISFGLLYRIEGGEWIIYPSSKEIMEVFLV